MRVWVVYLFLVNFGVCLREFGGGKLDGRIIEANPGRWKAAVSVEGGRGKEQSAREGLSWYLLKLKISRFLTKKQLQFYLRLLRYSWAYKKKVLMDKVKLLFKIIKGESKSVNYPLVGNKWVVEYNFEGNPEDIPEEKEILEFMDGGTVVSSRGMIGTWWTDFGELMWKIPVKKEKEEYLYFNAQICVNKIQNKPSMRRGVVYRDRREDNWLPKKLFRPVLGTFKAYCV